MKSLYFPDGKQTGWQSPPAREAWVEIIILRTQWKVALSPPAREAWVEMAIIKCGVLPVTVSPLAREAWVEINS